MKRRTSFPKVKVMFYLQLKDRRWNKPESPKRKAISTCKLSEVKAINEKSSKFTLNKATEYICNTQ